MIRNFRAELPPEHERVRLVSMPSALSQMSTLRDLNIMGMGLTSVPFLSERLTHLLKLSLEHNSINEVPSFIGNLTNLQRLALCGNRITSIPSSLGQLTMLEAFLLRGNVITSVPSSLARIVPGISEGITRNAMYVGLGAWAWGLGERGMDFRSNALTTIPADILTAGIRVKPPFAPALGYNNISLAAIEPVLASVSQVAQSSELELPPLNLYGNPACSGDSTIIDFPPAGDWEIRCCRSSADRGCS